jgi:hypothetical protein
MSPQQEPHSDDTSETVGGESERDSETKQEAELQELREENARLRSHYAEAKRSSYHRESLALATVGFVAGSVGMVITTAQQVLFSIAGIGIFAAILTWFLTPEQFIPANIGRAVFSPSARDRDAIAAQLGLSATRVYLVTEDGPRLFVPKRDEYELPAEDDLTDPFVIGDETTRGLSLEPSAKNLLDEFEATHQGPLPDDARELAILLVEGATEGLEVATNIKVDVDADDGRATFDIATAQFGPPAQFDHPVRSFLAVGMTRGLDQPVEAEWTTSSDEHFVVTVRWDPA